MKKWVTEFDAICVQSGEMRKWGGPNVEAPTAKLAQEWCYENAGHLRVVGELIMEIPCREADATIDYDIAQQN